VRTLILSRHGRSLFNLDGIVNGDPALDRGLAPEGREQALALGAQIAAIEIDLCVTSEFLRTRQTAELALGDRAGTTPSLVDPELNDVRIGSLEGGTLDDYRAWKRSHARTDHFPGGGETLDDAARRYAEAFERLADRPEATILCLCHEIPVRYAVNAAGGSDQLDGPLHHVPNATPYVFDEAGLRRAVERIRALS
jgi:broad specificity phosphatase PhoE